MPSQVLSAQQIAEHQLLAALNLWREGDYLSALTLAGAAEDILGRRLRKLNLEPSVDLLKQEIVAAAQRLGNSDPATPRVVVQFLNQSRNELKHYADDECLSFDLQADAAEMLERAIANYRQLTGTVLDGFIEFWGDTSDT